jgi:hypothetical protein
MQYSTAQRGFLLVQKKNKTIESYTTGAPIVLQHKYNYTIQGLLAHIKKDSFSVLNYTIQKKIDPRGFVYFDTLYNGYTFFAISDIKGIPKKDKRKSIIETASGASFLLGTSFTIVSLVNGIKFSDSLEEIGKNVAIKGGGFFALGWVLKKLKPTFYTFGKKYKLHLMQF